MCVCVCVCVRACACACACACMRASACACACVNFVYHTIILLRLMQNVQLFLCDVTDTIYCEAYNGVPMNGVVY